MVPGGAILYAQLIEADRWDKVPINLGNGRTIHVDCSEFNVFREQLAEPSWEGIRLESRDDCKPLSAPFVPFQFDFCPEKSDDLLAQREKVLRVPITRSGKFNAVVYWFQLSFDSIAELRLSTGPGLSRAWCQAIQFMSSSSNFDFDFFFWGSGGGGYLLLCIYYIDFHFSNLNLNCNMFIFLN